ncbi:MAG: tetratricopeptide repeat protein [Rhodospirillaceae bacterium]|jgi:protein O-GlcNAc transferase|nr:tetratricopeptide repeat protein [Rhodospirillaceae bacterium]MBT5245061.1 tetratricopeptide repeat protein [Rhodospirillaceae bacterium]MBT5561444.1 tetratricopeptide repeat protein [Rhodospirillaceae bacterium]MBT6241270.1 tetratricopeptide repeat protein [Rhodospirillaceae bacterium]MBT7137417.1 tetratricopeptide repeat protein [Rhodospirillaceae bacterium]
MNPKEMPQHLVVMLETAIDHQSAGRMNEAAALYQQVLQIDPANTFANHLFGVMHVHAGQAQTGVTLIETALKGDPENPEILNNLSSALIGAGRKDDALAAARRALEHKPDYPEALNTLGRLLVDAGQYGEAEQSIRRAIDLKPELLAAHNNLGNALLGLERLDEAEESFRRALELSPNYPDGLNNLGCLLARQGKIDEAEQSFRRVLELAPESVDGLNNLGNLFMVDDRTVEAEECYRHALTVALDNPKVLTNLGDALQHLERIEEAETCFRRALELQPDYIRALCALAHAQVSAGFFQDALSTYDKAISCDPQNTGIKVKRALALPIIPASLEDIEQARAHVMESVEDLIATGGSLKEPDGEAGITGFYLAYHNANDVPLTRKIAEMYLKLCPSLDWQGKLSGSQSPDGKYRIGFISYHFYDHTIGKLCRGIFEHLDSEKFEVVIFRTSRKSDHMSEAIESVAAKVVTLPQNLESARAVIADEALDLLYYPDIGMDTFTYFLAFARLAPVQVTSWGHPMSTGIPNIDYFVSSMDLETDNAQDNYSETLVRLAHPPTYYYRPEIPDVTDTRASHGLSDDENIYLCPQTLFKFHPGFDAILGDILRGDPVGRLVLLAGRYPSKERLLRERFAKTFPDVLDRVVFLPRMKMADFLCLVRSADVILDPVYFSGGNSTAETFALGVPIVTWPDKYLRDRVTYAFYKTMGISELIADSAGHYVSLANQLATDKEFHARMSKLIKDNAELFFENIKVVRELEDFMVAAIEAERKASDPVQWDGQVTTS